MIELAVAKKPEIEEVLMVGDMETDKEAAIAAHIKFMWASEWLGIV